LFALMVMMDRFNCLFEAEGDQQTDANRCDVDKEVFPSVDQLVGCVHV
jgi:hypothetical protein